MEHSFTAEMRINGIFVCQALPDGEMSTGIGLARDTLKPICDTAGMHMEACKVRNRTGFRAFMERVERKTTEDGVLPVLHLDVHGMQDRTGLMLPTGETVDWGEFCHLCRSINKASANNLLVVLAVCHGYHAVLRATIKEVTPFFALIGPTDAVHVSEIEGAFPKFYRTLVDSGDLAAACCVLGHAYRLYLCEQVFANGPEQYIREHCRGRGRQERVEQLLTEFKQSPNGMLLATGDARRRIKELLRPDASSLEKLRSGFLMAGAAANTGRFRASVDELIEMAFT